MKNIRYILFVCLTGLLMTSCFTAKKVNYMQEPNKDIPHYADTLSFEEYRLRVDDRISVFVYSLDENITSMYNAGMRSNQMNQGSGTNNQLDLYTYLVDKDGNIDFPTIGKVYVRGMTTREVKYKMEEELSTLLKDIPGHSAVSVDVRITNRSFSIIGAQCGRYLINKEKMTIFEALALAGDLQEFNSRHEIKIVRENEGQTTIKTFDVRSKEIVNSEFYYIEPNDIIYIRKIPGYSFGINSASTALSVVATTLSFGVFVYSIVQTGINHVKAKKERDNAAAEAAKQQQTTNEGGAQ